MEQNEKKPLIILTGPTAVGKTELSIELAKAVNGEILSADSMQVYRGMDIGTAKIKKEEMQGIPHYMIDELDPDEEFNVYIFQEKIRRYMIDIYDRGKIPILTGGTGFYIQALAYGIDFTENEDTSHIREELEQEAKEKGPEYLHGLLRQVDPDSAEAIHPNNVKRVIRAIEFYRLTGQQISSHNRKERQKESPYDLYYYVLTCERERLYRRIEQRVDQMLEAGLIEEVRRLKEMGCTRTMVAMQGLGYKEILDYLDGRCTLDEAVYVLKRDTRHFAKRQLTWFRRERDVRWIKLEDYEFDKSRILEGILNNMEKTSE